MKKWVKYVVTSAHLTWFQLPAGAVSIFGGGDNLFKAAIKKAKKAEDDMVTIMILTYLTLIWWNGGNYDLMTW